MEPNTHLALNRALCGTPAALRVGAAEVELETTDDMRADELGLVHGGFIFGLADHAAMLAVNAPSVVLGSAESKFLAPVTVGERVRAVANVTAVEGKRQRVEAAVYCGEKRVFEGAFVCFVPERHVLEARGGAR